MKPRRQRWKPIEGYPSYKIGSKGDVLSFAKDDKTEGRPLRPRTTNRGYYRVQLYRNGKSKWFLIHRLVAKAFIPNPDNKAEVNHKSGIKENNRVSNLEWVTRSENEHHALKHRLKIIGRRVYAVHCTSGLKLCFNSLVEAGRFFKVSPETIRHKLNNATTIGGFDLIDPEKMGENASINFFLLAFLGAGNYSVRDLYTEGSMFRVMLRHMGHKRNIPNPKMHQTPSIQTQ